MRYLDAIQERYELLVPLKIRLFIGMMVAANSAALAIYLACKFADFEIGYNQALALFLIYRVCAFMANPQMKLTDESVAFMSSERILWNLASFVVLMATWAIVSIGWALLKLAKSAILMMPLLSNYLAS
jgi:hypothetical protein